MSVTGVGPSRTMNLSDLPPNYRTIAEQKAVKPGATTVSAADAKAVFDQFVTQNRIPLNAGGFVDLQQATPGEDLELFLQAKTLQEFALFVAKGDAFEPAPREGVLDRLFGRIFSSTPTPPSNTEGLPSGRGRKEPSASLDWLDQVNSIHK